MRNINYAFVILLYLAVFVSGSFAQIKSNTSPEINENLKNTLNDLYNLDFQVSSFDLNRLFDMKELYKINYSSDDLSFKLNDCILFSAFVKPDVYDEYEEFKKGIVGILKYNKIVWSTDTSLVGFYSQLYFADDITNNGKIEIGLIGKESHSNLYRDLMLILSWDGSRGEIISKLDLASKSTIISQEVFDLFDVENDGIMEIRGVWPYDDSEIRNYFPAYNPSLTSPFITYNFNGINYSFNSDYYQLPGDQFFPANRLIVTVFVEIKKLNNILFYKYTISNLPQSKQGIQSIHFGDIKSKNNGSIKPENTYWVEYTNGVINGWTWETSDGLLNTIKPNETVQDFGFKCVSIPGIVNYYLQGNRPLNYELTNESEDEFYTSIQNDIVSNSLTGLTIGPQDPPNPFESTNFLDTLINYNDRSYELEWIKDQQTHDKYAGYLNTIKTSIEQEHISLARSTLSILLEQVDIDSSSTLTSEAYALLRFNSEYLLDQLPDDSNPNLIVDFVDSQGSRLTDGMVKYYEGGWRDAVDNGDGSFTVETDLSQVSLRMIYENASQTVSHIPAQNNTYSFQTVNTQIELRDSQGNLINEECSVKYYAGGWQEFGTTSSGVAEKELLPNNYSFRITYAFASNDKKQDIGTDPTVVFQTLNTQVELRDSQNNQIADEASVKYYSGGWREFGTTSGGVVAKELLPNNYSFRMTYAFASDDKKQDVGVDPTIVFQTINTQVELRDSQNELIAEDATVKYYSGGWREFGTASDGIVTKELLPNNYSFRMTYAFASDDKKQDIEFAPIVIFQTTKTQIELRDSQNNLITDEAGVKYYSGGWREFGTTSDGIVKKELLPSSYSFRMTYEFASDDKKQDVGTDPNVVFQTINTQVELRDSQNELITEEATVKYYSSGWREFGTTSDGIVTKELLANSYSFRMTYGFASDDKKQDIEVAPIVIFQTAKTQVELRDSQNELITEDATVKYYSGGWREFGTISNGVAKKELLPNNYSFRITYAFASNDRKQDIGVGSTVIFQTQNTQVELRDSQNNIITEEATVKYYSGGWREFGTASNGVVTKELLPNNYSFRMTYAFASDDKKQDVGTDPTVVFQTINTLVELRDSQNELITDEANVKYYSGGWREFGTTSNGVAAKELLPNNYSFRMTYAFASDDKKQDVGTDPTVVFQTINTLVELRDSQNELITDEANVKYYSGGWREFGTTSNGFTVKELLPNNYSFRITYDFISNDKKQDIGSTPTVEFSTINCSVSVMNGNDQPISGALIKYYSGGWRIVGETVNGMIAKELLPQNLTFRASYLTEQADIKQDIGINNNVEFILSVTE